MTKFRFGGLSSVVAVISLALLLAACGGADDNDNAGNDGAVETNANAATNNDQANNDAAANNGDGDVVHIELVASNFDFDQEQYTVPAGSTVEITLVNDQGYHEAEIDGFGEVTPDNPLVFEANEAGEYTIACSILCGPVDDHDNMVSMLVVE